MSGAETFFAIIDYEDPYVEPLILSALQSQLPPRSYTLLDSSDRDSNERLPQLQIRSYESLDFELALSNPRHILLNAYVIRKALIRKHFLSNTIASHVTKQPDSPLSRHFAPSVSFELDYAEFLDDALVEAFELREAFARNEGKPPAERQWWILKPGMSDRGQGIRLFSTEDELRAIFEQWEAENPDTDDEDGGDEEPDSERDENNETAAGPTADAPQSNRSLFPSEGIMTSHLRHFAAQPYLHPSLLVPDAPFSNRKFHIRTYVVAAGALRVYVYAPMLALFASARYAPPWECSPAGNTDDDDDGDGLAMTDGLLQRMRDTHLTNTCVQTSQRGGTSAAQAQSPVHLLSSLPLSQKTHESIRAQICSATAELFRAALALPTHFQPLPGCFEVFGVDFLVDARENVWLLEVNAFPDFAQTGEELRDLVVRGLWEEVVGCVVGPWFGVAGMSEQVHGSERLMEVLNVDLGRR